MNRSMPDRNYFIVISVGLIVLFAIILFAQICRAGEINMSIIAQIESSNNPLAYNAHSKATGLYQITPVCLADYNAYNKKTYSLNDMYKPDKCFKVSYWYLNKRIPQLLKYYNIIVTRDNILICYNWGIGHLISGKTIPTETRDYLKKYLTLNKNCNII